MMRILFLLINFTILTASPCEQVNFSCNDGQTYPVHLTFDDGPHDYNTGRILDILKSEDVPASFFLQVLKVVNKNGKPINYSGRRSDLASKGIPNYYYFLMDRMKDEGHYIGSHAYEHWHTVDSYLEGDNWQDNIEMGYPEVLKPYFENKSSALIRLPHGQGWFEQTSVNPEKRRIAEVIMDKLESLGMLHIGWNIDGEDWRYNSEQKSFKNIDGEIERFASESEMNQHYQQSVVDQICQQEGGIVLMHDAKEINWKNLSCLIKGLKKEGHQFVIPEHFIGHERAWGAPLIGRKTMDQSLCCAFFDSTISPLEEERMTQFASFIQYIAKKYSD